MQTPRTIPALLDAANSHDLAIAGAACRELVKRATECGDHIQRLVELLRHANSAIADLAFRAIERIGESAVPTLIHTYQNSQDEFRRLLMGLIVETARFEQYFPILKSEINEGEPASRYWAANLLGREFNDHVHWPPDAIDLLDDAVEILAALRSDPENWSQARMTLKHLGRRPNGHRP